MKGKLTIILTVLLFFVVAVALFVKIYTKPGTPKSVVASNTQNILTNLVDWTAGTLSNIDTASSEGSFIIDDKGTPSTSDGTYSYSSCAVPPQNTDLVHDSLTDTWISIGCAGNYVEWDFGETRTIARSSTFIVEVDTEALTSPEISVQYWTGSTWTELYKATSLGASWENHDISPPISTTKIKYVHQMNPLESADEAVDFSEVLIYSPATATHTSAATQITNANLYQWQTFTPTYTKPANTTVSFRLRTSTDAATWTSWTAYQTPNSAEALDISSLVTSKTGDAGSETFYKYIQVETKLTSSDGVSTPTIDSYSIGYHTNVVPSKPTGGTATAGD